MNQHYNRGASSYGVQAPPVTYSQELLLSHLAKSSAASQQDVSKGVSTGRTMLADLTNNGQALQRSAATADRKVLSHVSGQQPASFGQAPKVQHGYVPASIPHGAFSDPRIIDSVRQSGDFDRKKKSWLDVDAMNHDDPQAVSHYASAIFEYLREAELLRRPAPDYIDSQPEINAKMRSILVDWLVEVSEEYRMVPDTLYYAVNFLDRVLSVQRVSRSQLQLVGITCMWIAAKYEEIYPPNVGEFSYITDNTYSREQLVAMEEEVLKKLKYELTVPTAKTFLRRLLQVCNPDDQLHFVSNYLTEISLMEASMLNFLPSEIAGAAVYLANLILARPPWSPTLEHYSYYAPVQIADCVEALAALHIKVNTRAQGGELTALYDKYSHSKFLGVSRVSPLPQAVVSQHLAMMLSDNSASGLSSRA
ncbi:Cyclin-A1-2 [Pleodorina starrii]|uniref:Cyclin-A1-2 n=1 Tax=Pleodorina starrii TaxID=330485 RepID=A0A9W6BEX8_9CHLO|nr:Cyclin-A1-2 [Pleodorina starrii]GLC50829.1 Cyclin-A1-2 [Pleodorina starrii]GLC73977.1 Cyclin-A1-2 [Pleodorina starrii]